VSQLQRRDSRRNTIVPSIDYSANSSSYSGYCDLESHFSSSFIYVWLAVHRHPGGDLRPHCSRKDSQVCRRARR